MKTWLVGSGYWGSKVKAAVESLGHTVSVIDVKNNTSIDDINTLDPVIIATPLWDHYDQASHLLKKGHDVYIEKPAAENAQQVKNLLTLVNNQVAMVGHMFVYNPLIDRLKHLISQGVLGNIKFIHSERTNLGIYQTKTSTLLSLAPHDFSIIEYLTGSLHVNSAFGHKLSDNAQHDRVTVFGNSGEIPWQIDVSWRWPIRRRLVTVVGDRGQAVWDEDLKEITIYYNEVQGDRLVTVRENEVATNNQLTEPLVLQLEHFFDCVNSRKIPKTDLNNALSIAYAIDAAHAYL